MHHKFRDVEALYNRDWKDLLRDWYIKSKMSSYEICEKIEKETGVIFSDRHLRRWLSKFDLIRNHAESLKNRVMTGRMDYSKRNLDFQTRYIDYDARDKQRGYRWAVGLQRLLLSLGEMETPNEFGGNTDIVFLLRNLI